MSPAPHVNRNLASMLFGPPAAMLAAHKPRTRLLNYPLNVRPENARRLMYWNFLSVVAGGAFVLFEFSVPTGYVAVINRFTSIGMGLVSFTLSVDGIDDPVISEVGHFRGIPPSYEIHEKQVFWPYREYFMGGVMGHMLIDPVLADSGQEVKLRGFNYSLTGAAEFGGGVSGFYCDRPEKWSMGR